MEMLSAHGSSASVLLALMLLGPWGKQLDSEQIWKIVTYLRSLKQAG